MQVWKEMPLERGQEVQRPEMGQSFAYSRVGKGGRTQEAELERRLACLSGHQVK